MCDNNSPSLVASLFSWRCLAASSSAFLHAAMNLRPPSVTASTHTSLSLQCRRFPIPRYAKRPDVALYVIGPLFLLPTPSSLHCKLKVSEHDSLWRPPAAHSNERARPTKVFSCATLSQCSRTGLSQGHGYTRSCDGLFSY